MDKHPFYSKTNGKSIYSAGVKSFLEGAEAYWLYDIIQFSIYQSIKNLSPNKYHFYVSAQNQKVKIELEDSKLNKVYLQYIDFSTMPEGEIILNISWTGTEMITCLSNED